MIVICLKCNARFKLSVLTVWAITDEWNNEEIVIVCPHCGKRHII